MNVKTTRQLLVGLTSAGLLFGGFAAHSASHREAPFITKHPKVDATDFYAFRSYEAGREDFVTLIANYVPLQDAYGGPNYFSMDPHAIYEIHVDNNGDAIEDLTFQFQFSNTLSNAGNGFELMIDGEAVAVPLKNIGSISATNSEALNFNESYTLTMIQGERRADSSTRTAATNADTGSTNFGKPYDYVGTKTFPSGSYADYANSFIYNVSIDGCGDGRVFVGQRKEGFAIDLGKVFDLVNLVPVEGDSAPGEGDGGGFPGGVTQNAANNILADKNITTLALELPISCLTTSNSTVIGAWTSSSLRQIRLLNPEATFEIPSVTGGRWVQVSRLGSPLVNEVVIGIGDKDRFNSSEPKNDGQFATYVTNPSLPALLNILFRDAVNTTLGQNIENLAPDNFPRMDLVAAFLKGVEGVNANGSTAEMLRLNTAIAPTVRDSQSTFGVAGDDLAGYPNGRRPGDDVVDIALRVVMGALCYDVPVMGTPTNLGFCAPENAPVGNVPFTDGVPTSAAEFSDTFPYLLTPVPGS